MKEFLDILLSSIPSWALFAFEVWDRLKRRRKPGKSDGKGSVD